MEELLYWTKMAVARWQDYQGRSRRREYWYYCLSAAIVGLLAQLLLRVFNPLFGSAVGGLLFMLVSIALFIPSLAVQVRRLHDIGKSGWWALLNLLPMLGPIVLIIFLVQDSQPGSNQWGANPKGVK